MPDALSRAKRSAKSPISPSMSLARVMGAKMHSRISANPGGSRVSPIWPVAVIVSGSSVMVRLTVTAGSVEVMVSVPEPALTERPRR